ncbi:hypothetical protein K1719_023159 [Acacia pycnantha]|nr:hypothetical protein K1719_023159 [Acacia pycnantha]
MDDLFKYDFLFKYKPCFKNFNNLIEEDDYIYEHINIQKLPYIPWFLKPQESSFLAHCLIEEDDYIYEHINIKKLPYFPLFLKPQEYSFLTRCRECKNPESLYREGMAKYFSFNPRIMDLDDGLEILKETSMKGHVEARYVCGMILLCSKVEEQRKHGFEFLSFFLGKLRCVKTCRNKVEAYLRLIWKNDHVCTMFKDHRRLCGFDMCRGLQETARLERARPVLDDDEDDDEDEDEASSISCELCRWDYELHQFSKICMLLN